MLDVCPRITVEEEKERKVMPNLWAEVIGIIENINDACQVPTRWVAAAELDRGRSRDLWQHGARKSY
jgi:hypothetical protein